MPSKVLLLLALAAGATGCVRAYRPPTAAEPHAVVKLRRVYEKSAGAHLTEAAAIDGHPAYGERVATSLALAPRIDALLVHPKAAELEVVSRFTHPEMRTFQESYTVQVPYTTTESYSCGYGTQSRTCTRMATHYRSETRWRTVTRVVDVEDGSCREALWLAPENGRTYLVELTYRDHGVCSASCFEQVAAGADGSFQNRPCPVPTGAEIAANRDSR